MIGADRVELVKELAPILGPLVSAVLVAVLNNWDKINPGKKYTKQILESVTQQKTEIAKLSEQMTRMQSAQRTALQTQILEYLNEQKRNVTIEELSELFGRECQNDDILTAVVMLEKQGKIEKSSFKIQKSVLVNIQLLVYYIS